jgi:hypothetical protein
MSIILRTNKGSALSYDEMDRNQAQFFYSSSKSPDGLKLRLHYTGSDNLDTTEDFGPTRYHEVSFPVFEAEVPDSNVAGDNTQIQFNTTVAGISSFDADPLFVFTRGDDSVGIGTTTPYQRLDIQGDANRPGTIALRGSVNHDGLDQGKASVEFYKGVGENNLLGQIGRIEKGAATRDDLYIHAGPTNLSSGFAPDTTEKIVHSFRISLGDLTTSITPYDQIGATFQRIGTSSTINAGINNKAPLLNLSVLGTSGIGITHTSIAKNEHSILRPIDGNNSYISKLDGGQNRKLFPNGGVPAGIEISTPSNTNGGSVLMVLNTNNLDGTNLRKEAFNIISTLQNDVDDAALVATFQASGRVGIGTNLPLHEGLTVQKELSVKTRQVVDTSSEIARTLVADTTGLVKEVVAAPVPIGGIIMWSGDTGSIPAGWRLCKNGVGEVNGVAVPNLSNRFIIASSNSTGTPTTTILGTGATSTGGSNTHNHGGDTEATTLTLNQIPSHTHDYDDAYYAEARSGNPQHNVRGDADGGGTDVDNEFTWRTRDNNGQFYSSPPSGASQPRSEESGGGQSHKHDIDTASNIPEFYALAYIIYVGV